MLSRKNCQGFTVKKTFYRRMRGLTRGWYREWLGELLAPDLLPVLVPANDVPCNSFRDFHLVNDVVMFISTQQILCCVCESIKSFGSIRFRSSDARLRPLLDHRS